MKPRVVIVCESLPPYRATLHARARREIPEIELLTAVTHDPQDGRWPVVPQADVPHVGFGPGQLTGGGISPAALAREWRKGGRIVDWLNGVRPAALIVHGYNDPARLRVLAWAAARGVPAFVSGDSNVRLDLPRGLARLLKPAYLHPLLRSAAGAMPFGTYGAAYFRRYGVPAARIFRVPLEPRYDLVEQVTPQQAAAAAARHKLAAGRRRVLFSGRFIHEKHTDLLIPAFAAVADRRPTWDLVLLGDGPLKPAAQALVPPRLADRFVWLPNLRDPADVFAVYHCCDALVLPSRYDAWALVVNEACAAGLAIVCSDVVGAGADLVRDGVNGRVFRSGDEAGLAAALLEVTDEATLAGRKAASRESIARWRRDADPVQGLRAAFRSVGVI